MTVRVIHRYHEGLNICALKSGIENLGNSNSIFLQNINRVNNGHVEEGQQKLDSFQNVYKDINTLAATPCLSNQLFSNPRMNPRKFLH